MGMLAGAACPDCTVSLLTGVAVSDMSPMAAWLAWSKQLAVMAPPIEVDPLTDMFSPPNPAELSNGIVENPAPIRVPLPFLRTQLAQSSAFGPLVTTSPVSETRYLPGTTCKVATFTKLVSLRLVLVLAKIFVYALAMPPAWVHEIGCSKEWHRGEPEVSTRSAPVRAE